ncbi:hypothetical protein QBC46DRAFT_258295 [Diplogelasinospora grovesii]|uniref:Uncharacterized protein n=1 Tax=Diplogelasinospora grovesii TaxID=303347 RepID=A0AAN6NAU2_9PEZI|nr:hypothetical protein QBC46DRAFT_258295 [Diplogelasinospora grovesii]
MAPELYWREFTRDGSVDRDFLADENFLIANFSDWFGRWLQEKDHATLQSFDSLVRHFWGESRNPPKYDVDTFMVADGSFFSEDQPQPEWFTPHVRFLTVVKPAGTESFARKTSPEDDKWTFAIAGKISERQHTYTREHSFLDVASWDGVTVRYYKNDYVNGKDKQAWIHFGESMDAFGRSEYLGPFNGHVNGAPIMKELHEPWIHWLGQSGTFEACFSNEMKEDFKSAPYLSRNRVLLSEVNHNPEQLEDAIKGSVSNFFITRRDRDFKEGSKLRKKPQHIPRWTAHVFLTTTVNIVAALPVSGSDTEFVIPNEHFFDKEVLRRDRFPDLYVS